MTDREINPNSPDWLDGYLTAETEYEAGHGHKDDLIHKAEAERDRYLSSLRAVREVAGELYEALKDGHDDSPPEWSEVRRAALARYESLCDRLDEELGEGE